MATPSWVTYGNEGGAKAQQIARLRELFGGVGPLTQEQRTYMAYGGDQMIETPYSFYSSPNLANIFQQLGLPNAPDTYANRTMYGSGASDPPTGLEYTLPVMADPEREGKTGAYGISLNPDGSIADIKWNPYEQHGGWFSENMDWLGPALVGGAAFLGGGGLGGIGGTAAPISASPISSLGPAATLSDVAAFTGAIPASTSTLAAPLAGTGTATAGGATAGGSMVAPAVTSGVTGTIAQQAARSLAPSGGSNELGLLASLFNAYSQNRQGAAQQDWADRLYQDRSQFLEPLVRTYSNPEEYLSGPEYTAAAGITLDLLQRKDAARGRLATDVERQKLMQDHALQSLGNYRSGLATAAGLSPTQGLADLFVTGQANKYGTFNAPISELARILEGNNSFDFDDLLDDIIGGWF